MGSEEAGLFANRSMRLREEADDLEGMIYGHALLAHIAKSEGDFEKSQIHLQKRLDIIPESEKFERMEAIADLAHSYSSLGELEQAQAMLIDSLQIATELDELSGILVARWGLADLAEISDQPDEAMVQLSEIMTVFMEAGAVVPEPVRERISKLTSNSDVDTLSPSPIGRGIGWSSTYFSRYRRLQTIMDSLQANLKCSQITIHNWKQQTV